LFTLRNVSLGSNNRQFVPLIRKVAAGQAVIESRRGDYIPANRHESSLCIPPKPFWQDTLGRRREH